MLKVIDINKLISKQNVRNERDEELSELTASIEKHGLLNPLTVQELPGGKYEIIAGHRRYEALKRISEPYVECNVLEDEYSAQEVMQLQMIENVQRKEMSAYELVQIFNIYANKGWTQKKIAQLFHKPTSWVVNNYEAVRILEREYESGIIPEEKKKLSSGVIRAGYRRKVAGDVESITCNGMTVRHRGHEYMIHCANYEAEQALQQFIQERKI